MELGKRVVPQFNWERLVESGKRDVIELHKNSLFIGRWMSYGRGVL